MSNFQTQINNRLCVIRDFKSLDNLLNEATPSVSFFGKKYFAFRNLKNGDSCATLNFSSIIKKEAQILHQKYHYTPDFNVMSSNERKIGKKLESKLKKLNHDMDVKIKNSSFITQCFAFLRSFFSKINPFSTTNNFIKNGFDRLNYYAEYEWKREFPSFSLPKYPDKVQNKYFYPTALYKTPSQINNFGRRIINSIYPSDPGVKIGITYVAMIAIMGFSAALIKSTS